MRVTFSTPKELMLWGGHELIFFLTFFYGFAIINIHQTEYRTVRCKRKAWESINLLSCAFLFDIYPFSFSKIRPPDGKKRGISYVRRKQEH